MDSEKKTEIKVGLTVIIGLILFILVYGWAKNFSLTSDNKFLSVQFNTVAGLEIGDVVSVNGVKKGMVESIESNQNSAITLIKFNEDPELKSDATFAIMMLDLMGGKKIEISAGNANEDIDYSKIQNGIFAGDISTAMATLNSVESDLVEVIKEIKVSLNSVNSFLGNEEFRNNVVSTVNNLNSAASNLNDLLIQNKDDLTNSISNLERLSNKLNVFFDENDSNLNSIVIGIDSTLTNTNSLISKMINFSNQVENSENNLGKLLYDEELLSNLKLSIEKINELTNLISEQLKSDGLKVEADVDLF